MGPREIDVLVATKVMGLTDDFCACRGERFSEGKWCYVCRGRNLAPYSTDIAVALEVVEKLSARYHWRITSPFESGALWFAGLTPLGTSGWNGRPDILVSGESAPMAIALAALGAVRITVE